MEIVECEECGKKMAKKPKYTQEERGGHLCNDCWKEEPSLEEIKKETRRLKEKRSYEGM